MRSYQLVEVTSLYPKYLEYFYKKHPEAGKLPYQEHINKIFSDSFGEANFIHIELNKIGIESQLIFYNAEDLQRSWNPSLKSADPMEILLGQLRSINPDVILISGASLFNKDQIEAIRAVLPKNGKLVAFHFSEVTEKIKNVMGLYDQIYTGSMFFVDDISLYCKSVRLLRHAFSESVLSRVKMTDIKEQSIVFPGSIFLGGHVHDDRLDMLTSLLDRRIPLEFYGDIYGAFFNSGIKNCIKELLKNGKGFLKKIDQEKKIRQITHSSVFGMEYYQVLSSYLCCLNLHSKAAGSGGGNMRLFEATGMGSCLITDTNNENSLLFDIDTQIITYQNFDDLCEKAEWLLSNVENAKQIAEAGQRRTLRDHTYQKKADSLNQYLVELLA